MLSRFKLLVSLKAFLLLVLFTTSLLSLNACKGEPSIEEITALVNQKIVKDVFKIKVPGFVNVINGVPTIAIAVPLDDPLAVNSVHKIFNSDFGFSKTDAQQNAIAVKKFKATLSFYEALQKGNFVKIESGEFFCTTCHEGYYAGYKVTLTKLGLERLRGGEPIAEQGPLSGATGFFNIANYEVDKITDISKIENTNTSLDGSYEFKFTKRLVNIAPKVTQEMILDLLEDSFYKVFIHNRA